MIKGLLVRNCKASGTSYERLTPQEAEFLAQALSDFDDGLEELHYEEQQSVFPIYDDTPQGKISQSIYDKILRKHKIAQGRFQG